MSLAIHKYEIPHQGTVNMPKGARLLHAESQLGSFFVWAIVDLDEKEEEQRDFLVIFGTGRIFDKSDLPHMRHLTTFQKDIFVWHVFEWVP